MHVPLGPSCKSRAANAEIEQNNGDRCEKRQIVQDWGLDRMPSSWCPKYEV